MLKAATLMPFLADFDVGAHLVGGFAGTSPEDVGVQAFARRAEAGEVGGAILFSYNIESPAQIRRLTSYLYALDIPETYRPLLIMIDQEGGRVQRLSAAKGFVPTPSAKALGALPAPELLLHARNMASQLANVGVNVNCAPVVDAAIGTRSVIDLAERSFGADLEHIETCARTLIKAHGDAGVATSMKHFPGLGAATGDTHQGLIDATLEWTDAALEPFAALSNAHPLSAVMSTHMVNKKLEPSGSPLTFSRRVMHTLLRETLNFSGVLLSDDLRMGAIAKHFSVEETIVRALSAGHDVLMFGENEAAMGDGRAAAHKPVERLHARAKQAVLAACEQGTLQVEDLRQSARRIAAWRQRLLGSGC